MSRIDDERQAEQLAQKLALQKRQEEDRAKDRRQATTAFSQLVGKQTQEADKGQKKQSVLKAAFEQAQARFGKEKKEAGVPLQADAERRLADAAKRAQQADARARSQIAATSQQASSAQSREAEGQRALQGRSSDAAAASLVSAGRAMDNASAGQGAQGRQSDQESGREALKQRREGVLASGNAPPASGGKAFSDELEAKGDGGGQGSSSGQGEDKKENAAPQTFRFNPALMAPTPVAQPRSAPISDKLRALANEIAQKIVERVRVGQNAAGKAEFQIDLKSNVLKGLSIKVSGGNGKISALFSGSDRDVMKLLRDQEGSLRKALAGRGLALVDFRIEDRA